MPTIYLPCGPPGIGKSTLKSRAVQAGVITADAVLASDEMRIKMAGTVDAQDINAEVFEVLYRILGIRLSKGLDAWIDATNMTHQAAVDFLAWKWEATIVAIAFPYRPSRAKHQNKTRADGRPPVPNAAMDRFIAVWKNLDVPANLPHAERDGRLQVRTLDDFLEGLDIVDSVC